MKQKHSSNVVWHEVLVSRGEREVLNGHKGAVVWSVRVKLVAA